MRARWVVTVAALMCAPAAAAQPAPAMLAQVPADALGFLGIDLVAARNSPALTAAVTRLVNATDLGDRADLIGAATSLVIAGVPGVRIPTMIVRGPTVRGALAFGAMWLDAAAKRRLASVLPDLAAVQWIAGTLEKSSSGFTLAGSAAFADPYVAARIAVAIGMGRKLVTSQLPAKVAIAVDKIAVTAMGAQVRISATWSEADLAALASL
jgi:hypothetical protein